LVWVGRLPRFALTIVESACYKDSSLIISVQTKLQMKMIACPAGRAN
jgi:hypothetical protein